MILRSDLLQFIGEALRALTPEPRHRPPGPFARWPGRIGKEPGGVTGLAESAGEALQVGLGAARHGMTAPHQADR